MMKTLLFGTGGSAVNLLDNLPENREYLAAIDNDEDKHGKVFRGMPIISPSKISQYDYDQILIACYWEGTIKKQLIEELGIDANKVVTPHKKYFKNAGENLHPFQHPPTLQLAHKLIDKICGGALQKQIPLHIDYGTLLGIMRDNELILWDDDIDLAADFQHADKIEAHLLSLIHELDKDVDWSLHKDVDINGRTLYFHLSFSPKQGCSYKSFPISIAMKGVQDGMAVKLSSFGAWSTPAHHTNTLVPFRWRDTDLYIPTDFDGYLRFTYGNWRSPKKDLSVGEGENWQTVPIEVIKQAKVTSKNLFGSN